MAPGGDGRNSRFTGSHEENPMKNRTSARAILRVVLLATILALPVHADFFDGTGYRYREYLQALIKCQRPLPDGNSVLVIGKVQRPGEVRYGDGIRASKAIAYAGGLARSARSGAIGIWKDAGGRILVFDLKAVVEKDPSAADPTLSGGDVVIVLENTLGH
jgi:hypothetical protein